MENRKDFMHLFRWEKEIYGTDRKADNGQRTVSAYQKNRKNHLQRGNSFQQNEQETMTDKINRLILHDINSEDFS